MGMVRRQRRRTLGVAVARPMPANELRARREGRAGNLKNVITLGNRWKTGGMAGKRGVVGATGFLRGRGCRAGFVRGKLPALLAAPLAGDNERKGGRLPAGRRHACGCQAREPDRQSRLLNELRRAPTPSRIGVGHHDTARPCDPPRRPESRDNNGHPCQGGRRHACPPCPGYRKLALSRPHVVGFSATALSHSTSAYITGLPSKPNVHRS